MKNKTLDFWLSHLESAHIGGEIDLGLGRVSCVKEQMNMAISCPLIVVGGTNGKGSVCTYLTSIYVAAGYKVGTLTSPHLFKFNERIAINGIPVSDEVIIGAFEQIEAARQDVSLTYFEFNTLAAVLVFLQHHVDVMILEVGLGGRLDAVNIFDADVSVVTNIDLDHQDYLGETIEDIAYEKAGIFRTDRPAVVGQYPLPKRMESWATEKNTPLLVLGRDITYKTLDNKQWSFTFTPPKDDTRFKAHKRHALPMPALRGAYQINNAACALGAIECLNASLPVDIASIKKGLLQAKIPGRFQVLPGRPVVVWDVGHNLHAARALHQSLLVLPFAQKRIAVFSMLSDKDIHGVLSLLKNDFDAWYIAPVNTVRSRTAENMVLDLEEVGIASKSIKVFVNINEAYNRALSDATENDRIVAFGSFYTVCDIVSQTN